MTDVSVVCSCSPSLLFCIVSVHLLASVAFCCVTCLAWSVRIELLRHGNCFASVSLHCCLFDSTLEALCGWQPNPLLLG